MRGVLFMSGNAFIGEVAPAAHSIKKREMWLLLADLDTNEDFWPTLLSRISDGEFISILATELKVNHSILRNWIRGNKGREIAFGEAEKQGMQSRRERVMQRVHETATAEINEPATRMEQLRAAEIMLKQAEHGRPAPAQFGDITISFVQAKEGRTIEGKVVDSVP